MQWEQECVCKVAGGVQGCCKTKGSGSGVEGYCRFYLEDLRRCKPGPQASLISHLHLFAFFCSFIQSVDVRQPKKLKASLEALSFALCTSSSGLEKIISVISRKRSLPGWVFAITLQTLWMKAEQFSQWSQVTCSFPILQLSFPFGTNMASDL